MTVTSTLPVAVVSTAIELERRRMREMLRGVYRSDGSVDEAALAKIVRILDGSIPPREF